MNDDDIFLDELNFQSNSIVNINAFDDSTVSFLEETVSSSFINHPEIELSEIPTTQTSPTTFQSADCQIELTEAPQTQPPPQKSRKRKSTSNSSNPQSKKRKKTFVEEPKSQEQQLTEPLAAAYARIQELISKLSTQKEFIQFCLMSHEKTIKENIALTTENQELKLRLYAKQSLEAVEIHKAKQTQETFTLEQVHPQLNTEPQPTAQKEIMNDKSLPGFINFVHTANGKPPQEFSKEFAQDILRHVKRTSF